MSNTSVYPYQSGGIWYPGGGTSVVPSLHNSSIDFKVLLDGCNHLWGSWVSQDRVSFSEYEQRQCCRCGLIQIRLVDWVK